MLRVEPLDLSFLQLQNVGGNLILAPGPPGPGAAGFGGHYALPPGFGGLHLAPPPAAPPPGPQQQQPDLVSVRGGRGGRASGGAGRVHAAREREARGAPS